MKIGNWIVLLAAFGTLSLAQSLKPEPKTFVLNCSGGDCPLLKGKPQTAGMRAGSVSLKPGESVGWHSTAGNEESLVILRGSGVAKLEGHEDIPLSQRHLAYIPPATRHNVTNTGAGILEYVWIVAPIASSQQ
jgi:mannose-6-phosphate isomerase-like protein (cupin superfamily)